MKISIGEFMGGEHVYSKLDSRIKELQDIAEKNQLSRECDEESSDNINPEHYKKGKYEVIDIIKGQLTRDQYMGYLLGNIWKYTMRFEHKNGVEDVEKAKWYIEKLIEFMKPDDKFYADELEKVKKVLGD